jgi:hypothetical protein
LAAIMAQFLTATDNGPYQTLWSEGGAVSRTESQNHAEGIGPQNVSP